MLQFKTITKNGGSCVEGRGGYGVAFVWCGFFFFFEVGKLDLLPEIC